MQIMPRLAPQNYQLSTRAPPPQSGTLPSNSVVFWLGPSAAAASSALLSHGPGQRDLQLLRFCSGEMEDAGTTPTGDKLVLRGLMFHGFHGVKQEERKLGQKFLVDVDAWMDLSKAGKSDSLDDTVSYTAIYRIVKDVVEGSSHNLLESVAHRIASTTLAKHSQISAIRVKLGKPHVAVHGPLDYLGIEITRYRDTGGPT